MQTSEFVKLLQNELILQRDPHIADRFAALLDEHFEERPPQEPQEPRLGLEVDFERTSSAMMAGNVMSEMAKMIGIMPA